VSGCATCRATRRGRVPAAGAIERGAARRTPVLSGARCRVPRETEVAVAGQLALVIETEIVVPAAVWEALPPERQLQVALRLARLLARLVEAARDE
jgi:hypothetical protein